MLISKPLSIMGFSHIRWPYWPLDSLLFSAAHSDRCRSRGLQLMVCWRCPWRGISGLMWEQAAGGRLRLRCVCLYTEQQLRVPAKLFWTERNSQSDLNQNIVSLLDYGGHGRTGENLSMVHAFPSFPNRLLPFCFFFVTISNVLNESMPQCCT